jgi:aspartate/methionine/tyrosine aminotransferase
MTGTSEGAEMELWQELFHTTGVLLTPGAGFGHSKRGAFRIVYPCVCTAELKVAMDRLAGFIGAKRAERRR